MPPIRAKRDRARGIPAERAMSELQQPFDYSSPRMTLVSRSLNLKY
ncbi:hypothetical protein [Oscillatoria sp. FACHB-1406]|nr:hypothetical protein [Oscillatoria sp. FACHB-1406]MBD2576341.1 hypothetical protein [Oscillatoria sp. FACHB-1406]